MRGYPFQRNSSPIVNWANGHPPRPAIAAETVALGSGDYTIVPGGPEMIQGVTDGCPACPLVLGALAIGGYLAWKKWGRR